MGGNGVVGLAVSGVAIAVAAAVAVTHDGHQRCNRSRYSKIRRDSPSYRLS